MDEYLYVVTEDFSPEMEGFLEVKRGQLVEVLNQSGGNWLVVTVVSSPGELEDEGFLPAHYLQPASKCESLNTISSIILCVDVYIYTFMKPYIAIQIIL